MLAKQSGYAKGCLPQAFCLWQLAVKDLPKKQKQPKLNRSCSCTTTKGNHNNIYLLLRCLGVLMLKVAVGHSDDPDSAYAIAEILDQCTTALAGAIPKAGLLIASIAFDHALILATICQAYPGIQLIGGTSVGEMSSVLGFQEDSVMLMLFSADDIEIQAGIGRNLSQDPVKATQQAVNQAKTHLTQPIKLCLTIAESLTSDAVTLLEGLTQNLGDTVPIYGGLSANDWRLGENFQLKKTYQFFGPEVLTDSVPVLLFSGNLVISSGVSTGQHPIGKQGLVTKSHGNTILEIDGRPALEFYREYFGEISVAGGSLLGGSIAVFEPNAEQYYLRSPDADNPEIGSVSYFGRVPEQSLIQLTKTDDEEILGALKASLQSAIQGYSGSQPTAAFIISCASRMKNLGSRAKEEYEAVETQLGKGFPSMGFYSFGEIGPFRSQPYFHNETFVTLLIGS
jgi:hypothetical protein